MFLELVTAILAPVPDLEDGWWTRYETAVRVSEKTGKPLMVNFTGSDWCSYCHVLDGDVFATPEFETWAQNNVVRVKVDFPQQKELPAWMKEQNEALAQKYGVQGFPTILFMDGNGTVMGQTGLVEHRGPNPWIKNANMILHKNGVSPVSFQGGAGFPPFVKDKTLYAKNDFRGKNIGELTFGTWLSGPAPDLKGKVVVVDFWATWCGPCRELIPEMNEWAKEFSKDVVFVGLSDEKPETVKAFMKSNPMDYPVATDPSQAMYKRLGVEGIPHVMVVTPDGVVRWQGWPQDPKDRLTEDVLGRIVESWKALAAKGV